MNRLLLKMLARSGATQGQVPAWDDATNRWVPSTISGGGSGGGGGVLLLENGASPPVDTAVGTIVFMKAAPVVTWSFSGGVLPAGWTRRGVATETFDAQGMTATLAAGQGYQAPVPDGNGSGNYTIEAELLAGSFSSVMMGPMITTSAGAGESAVPHSAPSGVLVGQVSGWSYASNFVNGGGTPAFPMRLRIRKSGDNYYASMSTNAGGVWTTEVTRAQALAVNTISVGSIFGSASMKLSYVKYTPSSAGGGLKGWWDGTQIVPF